jgi:hypothetical protein
VNYVVEVERSPKTILRRPNFSLWIRISFWLCVLIAVAAVIRRLVALAHPAQSGPPAMVSLDAVFSSHTALTLAHIVPALIFVLLTPLVYLRRFANKAWVEALLFPLGGIVGITAYLMSSNPVGGWIERSAVLFFNSLFLLCLFRAWQLRHGHRILHLQWMTRAIGILLGIATTRPIMGVFFATSRITHLTPSQFFGIAFWIGFSLNTLVVELWVRSRSARSQLEHLTLQRA